VRNISDTTRRLRAYKVTPPLGGLAEQDTRLSELSAFGTNPGQLRARTYIPANLPANAPLVVVLHGCTQTAAIYDHGSGWSRLADRHGFALLFPEQQRINNPNLCFNWFLPDDIGRDVGEALSIRQMVEAMILEHGLDRRRVYVTGLSAGGAMTSVMLAAYPDVFAGGAIIAGLPYGSAATIPEAFDRMRGHGGPTDAELQDLLRGASGHAGPWPTISIWHGSADQTVSVSNAERIVAQWRGVHHLTAAPRVATPANQHALRTWYDSDGRALIEAHIIAGMGHGTPIDANAAEGSGVAGPFMLDVGISSTLQIANSWGLVSRAGSEATVAATSTGSEPGYIPQLPELAKPAPDPQPPSRSTPIARHPSGVGKVIEDALRAAGLMR
jgi:poly(hydroxyalkanoate) depolymerase family esterase